jgi:hypothetical protein
MRIAIFVLLIATVVGCRSSEQRAYERLARDANPLLATMKPTATRVLASAPTQEQLNTLTLSDAQAAALVTACESADDQLWTIRKVEFDQEAIAPAPGRASVAEYAGWLLDHRELKCEHGARSRIVMCAFWCFDNWSGLIDEVERLRREAHKHGVNITSLRE